MVFEITSRSTRREDLGEKKLIYADLGGLSLTACGEGHRRSHDFLWLWMIFTAN